MSRKADYKASLLDTVGYFIIKTRSDSVEGICPGINFRLVLGCVIN